jgi:diaminopimelate epimerase
MILILESQDHDVSYRIYNSDGSQAQMCGNGMRCFAKLLYEKKILHQKVMTVDTQAGTIIPEVIVDENDTVQSVVVDMGEPILTACDVPFKSENETAIEEPLMVDGKEYKLTAVFMGNPHAVIFVDDVDAVDIRKVGRAIELHERFPEKTNVEFIEVVSDRELKMKVWERGAGPTLACGSGACASLVAASVTGRTGDRTLIHLDGGDLDIRWDKKTNHIFKTGPANLVFQGQISI